MHLGTQKETDFCKTLGRTEQKKKKLCKVNAGEEA